MGHLMECTCCGKGLVMYVSFKRIGMREGNQIDPSEGESGEIEKAKKYAAIHKAHFIDGNSVEAYQCKWCGKTLYVGEAIDDCFGKLVDNKRS